jgi:hypothetical protein
LSFPTSTQRRVTDTRSGLDSTELKIKNANKRRGRAEETCRRSSRNNHKPYYQGPKHVAQKSKFEGRCKELEGYVYDICGAQQANQYMKTTEEIGLYVSQHYSHGADIGTAVQTLARPVIKDLADPAPDASLAVKKRWEDQLKRWNQRMDTLEENISKLYNLVWGQCSDALRAKIESQPEFARIRDYPMEGIELLKLIKTISFKFEPQVYKPLAIDDAMRKFMSARQGKQMQAAEYLELFQTTLTYWRQWGRQ